MDLEERMAKIEGALSRCASVSLEFKEEVNHRFPELRERYKPEDRRLKPQDGGWEVRMVHHPPYRDDAFEISLKRRLVIK